MRALLSPARLNLLHGARRTLRGFHQELAHRALRESEGAVLWCDGDHGFDPYHFAERNLVAGQEADWGADRLLVKRCMTPFQWDTVLTKHLQQKLLETEAAAVLAAPFDALYSTDELKEWEQEDYVAYSLAHLHDLARRHDVPIFLSVDMERWWRTHPELARRTYEAVAARWTVRLAHDGWELHQDASSDVIAFSAKATTTLESFLPQPMLEVPNARAPRPVGR